MINSSEAPASVTYSLVTPGGFPILFTMRDDKVNELIIKMETLEPSLLKKGYKPQEKKFGSKPPAEIVPNRKCPLCGQALVYSTTKDGKKFIKCSTNKWDFATKQATGCKFTEWPDSTPTITR
jgi:hypothetical protein